MHFTEYRKFSFLVNKKFAFQLRASQSEIHIYKINILNFLNNSDVTIPYGLKLTLYRFKIVQSKFAKVEYRIIDTLDFIPTSNYDTVLKVENSRCLIRRR